MIVPLYEGMNYRGMVGKIYARTLVERVHRVIWCFIDDDQGRFRVGSGCVYQIFTLKHIGEKA